MVELTDDLIAAKVRDILASTAGGTVVVAENGEAVGAVVSMGEYERLRASHMDSFWDAAREMSAEVAAHAAELGISHQELVDRLLAEDD